MKNLVLFLCFFSLFFFGGCEKDPFEDYRKDFIGSYNLNMHKYGGYGISTNYTTFDTTYYSPGTVSYGSQKNTVIIKYNTGSGYDATREVMVAEDGRFSEGSGYNTFSGYFSRKNHSLAFETKAHSPASSTHFEASGNKQ